MHQGVRELVQWLQAHKEELLLNPPATAEDLAATEQALGTPLPSDLRHLLQRFNGGQLPSGWLLSAGQGPGSIGWAARLRGLEGSGPDSGLVPFYADAAERIEELSEAEWHAFDRASGPLPDTWPILSLDPSEPDRRPVIHRTLDGWCRMRRADWSDLPEQEASPLELYLQLGERHASIEPDVAVAHATVAHALRRLGRPREALQAYLKAARCVPSEPWCDWEALLLATLLGDRQAALEASRRLAAPAPWDQWRHRGTRPAFVAYVLALWTLRSPTQWSDRWLGQLDLLAAAELPDEERGYLDAVREAAAAEREPPAAPGAPALPTGIERLPPEEAWQWLEAGYREGAIRPEHLVLDPVARRLALPRPLRELLYVRREV